MKVSDNAFLYGIKWRTLKVGLPDIWCDRYFFLYNR